MDVWWCRRREHVAIESCDDPFTRVEVGRLCGGETLSGPFLVSYSCVACAAQYILCTL